MGRHVRQRAQSGTSGASGASGASAYHHVIVGETGSGKTYGANLLLYREALRGTQVVVLEPMGHSRRLMQAMGEGGSYNRVDFAHTSLNVLDIVENTLTDQVTHVQRSLAVLLSSAAGGGGAAATASQAAAGRAHRARRGGRGRMWPGGGYSPMQSLRLSARRCVTSTRVSTPQRSGRRRPRALSSCVRACGSRAIGGVWGCGHALADEIAGLYVDGVYGDVFNPREGTGLDLRLTSPGTAYDFSQVNDTFRPLLYSQVLAAVQRRIRNRERRQPMIVFIDEFRYMAQEPMLAEQAMLLVKTARTYRAAIWMAEQNLFTFSETFTGRAIIENTPLITLYRQTATATKIARELYPS